MDSLKAAERFAELFHSVYLRFYRRVEPTGYRPTQEALGILQHLALSGPLTVLEASRHFNRSQSATSELLNRLEARRLLRRMPDERDRRRNLVWLTEEGMAEFQRSQRVLSSELLAQALDQMDSGSRQQILEALEGLLATSTRRP